MTDHGFPTDSAPTTRLTISLGATLAAGLSGDKLLTIPPKMEAISILPGGPCSRLSD